MGHGLRLDNNKNKISILGSDFMTELRERERESLKRPETDLRDKEFYVKLSWSSLIVTLKSL